MLHVMRKKMQKKKEENERRRKILRNDEQFSSGQLQDRLKFELYIETRAGVSKQVKWDNEKNDNK